MSERRNQRTSVAALATVSVILLASAASAATGGPIFVSSGGAYNGAVGKPILMDAGASANADGGAIMGYYWDWFGDGVFECVTLPACQYTWHSAYSGTLVLHIWDEHGDVGAGATPITVTGPRNILTATLKSHADLHVFGPRNYHTGLSPLSGALKTQLPGSSFRVLDPDGKETKSSGGTPGEGCAQVVSWPLYLAGTYQVRVVGTSEGPFDLTINVSQDGTTVLEKAISGVICKGETATVNVTGSCTNGLLQVALEEPAYCPGLSVEPDEITLVVEAGKTYEAPLTVREPFLRTPLQSVSLRNEDITGPVNKVAAGAIRFEPASFDIEPGGQVRVVATIPVPQAFLGKATGRIVVGSANGAGAVVNVTLKTPGTCPPHCNGIGPLAGLVGAPVVFDARNSYDPDGQILHYAWDWDNDGAFEWTDQPVIAHTWDAPFTGKVRLVIFDNDDECADTYVEVTITNP